MSKKKNKRGENIPRWAISLVDTTGELDAITVAQPDLMLLHDKLMEKLPKEYITKGVFNEFDRIFDFMNEKLKAVESGKIKKI